MQGIRRLQSGKLLVSAQVLRSDHLAPAARKAVVRSFYAVVHYCQGVRAGNHSRQVRLNRFTELVSTIRSRNPNGEQYIMVAASL